MTQSSAGRTSPQETKADFSLVYTTFNINLVNQISTLASELKNNSATLGSKKTELSALAKTLSEQNAILGKEVVFASEHVKVRDVVGADKQDEATRLSLSRVCDSYKAVEATLKEISAITTKAQKDIVTPDIPTLRRAFEVKIEALTMWNIQIKSAVDNVSGLREHLEKSLANTAEPARPKSPGGSKV